MFVLFLWNYLFSCANAFTGCIQLPSNWSRMPWHMDLCVFGFIKFHGWHIIFLLWEDMCETTDNEVVFSYIFNKEKEMWDLLTIYWRMIFSSVCKCGILDSCIKAPDFDLVSRFRSSVSLALTITDHIQLESLLIYYIYTVWYDVT